MKNLCLLILGTSLVTFPTVFGQAPPPGVPFPPPAPRRVAPVPVVVGDVEPGEPRPTPTKFDLDFPGGSPQALVRAIEKSLGKPINVMIADEHADSTLPAMKMTQVTVDQLFMAIQQATRRIQTYISGNSYSQRETACAFSTSGPRTENAVWTFQSDKLPSLPVIKTCRFYQLAPYLENNYRIEDITTAMQTGWKMLGRTNPPQISFHQDTRLLIAVGDADDLKLIEAVLQQLKEPAPARLPGPAQTDVQGTPPKKAP